MPDFQKPSFPAREANLSEVVMDSSQLITPALNRRISLMSQQGGGTITIPKGVWKSGRIELKSNIRLHLEDGAVIKFSFEVADYLPAVFTRVESLELMSLGACIYAHQAENIAITGKGRLIGPYGGEIKERSYLSPIETLIDLQAPAEQRVHDGSQENWIFPPKFISPTSCQNVYIEGITLENTAFWNIVPVYCDGVVIRGVQVNSVGIPRGDGIDVESSRNVLIEYCTLSTGDDCFTMKSGRGKDGLEVGRPTENVVVRYCLALQGHGGITCGSETAGTIQNLYVHDCVFDGTGVGIRFKTRRPRGGGGQKLYYDRIRMNLQYTAIKWDMLGTPAYVGALANRLPLLPVNELTPFYRDIHMSNLIIEHSTHFLKIFGIPESPMTNLTIDNVDASSTELITIHDAKNIAISNAQIQSAGNIINLLGSEGVRFDNVIFDLDTGKMELQIKDSEPPHFIP